jgi:hypothetical protein
MAPKRNGKITAEFLLTFYDACLREAEFQKIAAACGVSPKTLKTYISQSNPLQLASKMAAEKRGSRESLSNYILGSLSREAKKIWDDLQFWDGADDADRIEAIVGRCSVPMRQELYLHALVKTGYNPSKARRMVGVSKEALAGWRMDPDFHKLVEEVTEHKKDFFENALINLVEEGNPGAIIFVNRTVNAERGYGERLKVEHSVGELQFSIEDLELDLETRRMILQAIRKLKEQRMAADNAQKALPEAPPIDV